RVFCLDSIYGSCEQKCWSLDHSESCQLWDPLDAQCFDRWCESGCAGTRSILQRHPVARAACYIPHSDAGSWAFLNNDQECDGTSGSADKLNRGMERTSFGFEVNRHLK